MNLIQAPMMIFSHHDGWDDLIKIHPSITRLFTRLVLPFSLLPPIMIYYAGGHYGESFVPKVTADQWHTAAGIFFIAELLTVPVMAWLIQRIVSKAYDIQASYHECFVLAAVAPIPLWLSSLALFIPDLSANIMIGFVALLCSVGLIYHGAYALFHVHENLRAVQMAMVITCAGLFAWLLLIQIVLMH